MTSHADAPHIDIHGYALRSGLGPLWQRGDALARRRDFDGAAACMQAILDEQPEHAPALLQLAQFRLFGGGYRAGLELAGRMAGLPPATLEFALHAVRLLRRFELHEEASRVVAHSGWEHSSEAQLLCQLAGELGPIGLYEQAIGLLERAEKLAPGLRPMQILRGTVAFTAGDTEASRRYLRAALAAPGPDLPHVRWMLTLQPDDARIGQDIAAIRARLRDAVPRSEEEAYLAFGLHNLYHAEGEFEASWEALQQGCLAKRANMPYDRERQSGLFRSLASMPLEAAPAAPDREPCPRPVFIVGMYRSGTSVLERALAGHPELADGGESYVVRAAICAATDHYTTEPVDEATIQRLPAADLSLVAERIRAHARWKAKGRAVFTEKLPANFLHVGTLLSAMPEARVIHMRRDPVDTCFSNLRAFFTHAAAYSYDQGDLVHYYRSYRDLMAHWRRRFPDRILDVDYQAFVDSPEAQARRALAFCGLDYTPSVLDVERRGGYSATASIGTVRQGILRDRGRAWEPYRHHLGPLLEGLRPFAAAP